MILHAELSQNYCCPVKCVLLPMLLKFFHETKVTKRAEILSRISPLTFIYEKGLPNSNIYK